MKKRIILFALCLLPTIAVAEVTDPVLVMPEGQVLLSISATEREEVAQDLLVATVMYQTSGKDVREVQNEVNEAMEKAVKLVKKESEIKSHTGTYQVYEFTEPRTKDKKWRASQTLVFKSTNADRVLKITGELQALKFGISSLSYMVSPEVAVKTKDHLMEGALKQLQQRALRAAKALGKKSAALRDVQVESDRGGASPAPYMAHQRSAVAAEMDMSTPVATAGETTISLTVTARAILTP